MVYPGILIEVTLYLPGQFTWVPNYSLGPLNAKRSCPKIKFGMGYVKMHGFMATHSGFENVGMPTNGLISQLFLIVDY